MAETVKKAITSLVAKIVDWVIVLFCVAIILAPFGTCAYIIDRATDGGRAMAPVAEPVDRVYYVKQYGTVHCGGAYQSECGLTLFNCTDEFIYFCVDNVRRRGDGIERMVPRP